MSACVSFDPWGSSAGSRVLISVHFEIGKMKCSAAERKCPGIHALRDRGLGLFIQIENSSQTQPQSAGWNDEKRCGQWGAVRTTISAAKNSNITRHAVRVIMRLQDARQRHGRSAFTAVRPSEH